MKKITFLLLFFSFLLSGAATWIVVTRLGPYDDTWWLSLGLFYLSTFFMLASAFAFIGSAVRAISFRDELYMVHFKNALRQGILLSLFCISFLLFSHLGVVTWWNVTLLFVAFFLVELFFITRSPNL